MDLIKPIIIPSAFLFVACSQNAGEQKRTIKPNILIIYADDLGYGDISVNGAIGVKTPNIDSLAINGLNFTDAHCSAATSTPSRYALLTGSYAFRANAAILPGDAPLLINPAKGTLPTMLKNAGYHTGVVGKWHLGLGYGKVNWNDTIKPGPREIGFDYSFIIPATGDRVPCVFLEEQKVFNFNPNEPIEVNYDTIIEGIKSGLEYPHLMRLKSDPQHSNSIVNGVGRIGYMKGGESALWKDEDFSFVLIDKAKDFIRQSDNKPFFLYLAFHDIHVPRLPNAQFKGMSKMGTRGDAIFQMDWCVGEIVRYLKELKIEDNTIVVFSSDNGPVLDDGYMDNAKELVGDHNPAGLFRGGKYSAYEAGTRVPTIVYWPGVVKPGVSDALLSHVDLYASLASLTGQKLAKDDAPDSFDLLDTWLGKSHIGRKVMLEESFTYSLRHKKWKYINPQERLAPDWMVNKDIESGLMDQAQLYDLEKDIGEKNNIAEKNAVKVAEMKKILSDIINSETTRP